MAHCCALSSTNCLGSSCPPLAPPPIKRRCWFFAGQECVVSHSVINRRRGGVSPPFICCRCSTKVWFAVHRERHHVPQSAVRPSLLWPSRDSPSAATATTEGTASQSLNQSVRQTASQTVRRFSNTFTSKQRPATTKKKGRKV